MRTISNAPMDEKVTIRGTVRGLRLVRTRTGKQLVTASFTDEEGETVEVIWFNQPHIKRMLTEEQEVVLTGKLVANGRKLQFLSPTFETVGDRPLIHAGRMVPVYPQHDVLTTKWLREKMMLIKEAVAMIPETLSEDVVRNEKLPPRHEMVRMLHFPEGPDDILQARARLAFERMYLLQTEALERRKAWQATSQERLKTPMNAELIKHFFASLKFTPTNSQKIAIYEILRDMEKPVPMNRLLEGDVGSGKTLVATAIMAHVLQHGGQCALMVPTEVLAEQHARGITQLLLNFHSSQAKKGNGDQRLPIVRLLTGSTQGSIAREIKQNLAAGSVDIVIGTHALIEESVRFKDLRLVIVDEQHRFGVEQRRRLVEKGSPHFLTMTATPIPRTLALTAYGDHDLSVLLEKPGKRQAIETTVVPPKKRKQVEHFIDLEIAKGRQVFVICPLITESKELDDVKNVEVETKRLREEFPARKVQMLHGRMSAQEKQEIMKAFREKEFDILVSTSVIEVGIDIPNATVIIIEGAERFGLSQLHQLRGRVGRGDDKSYCFLFTTSAQQASSPRLKAMEKHDSGFLLAEIDMKLRGPGDLLGIRQSGLPEGTLTELMDPALIARARRAAERALGMHKGDVTKAFVV